MNDQKRSYSYSVSIELKAAGDFDPLEFSEVSGLQPSEVRLKGSTRMEGDVCIPNRNIWTLKGERLLSNDDARVEEALEAFVNTLSPCEQAPAQACRRFEVEVFVVIVVKFAISDL